MKINRITWTTFFFLSFISIITWLHFSYPQLEFVNFSIGRNEALRIAADYLRRRGEDPGRFKTAVIFASDEETNRYLQKTLGFRELIRFIRAYDVDMFYWAVRFFNENKKESYKLLISSSVGEVISFNHVIEDNAAREPVDREEARKKAQEFLRQSFQFDPSAYTVRGDLQKAFDNRSDFSFSWQRKDVGISWTKDKNDGLGRLLMDVKVSGNEILSFTKNAFLVPDPFKRHLSKIQSAGGIFTTTVHIFYFILFTGAIFFVIVRRNHLAMNTTKRFYIGLMIVSYVLSLVSTVNYFQHILYQYNTTASFKTYFWQLGITTVVNAVYLSIAIFMPSLAGETLHYQMFKDRPNGSFLHYIRSTFLSRQVSQSIFLGYFTCLLMLGIQSVMIEIGQRYWGVWTEHTWMSNTSTAYLPFLVAFTIGFKASFTEELMYRLFTISWGKKVLKSTFLAVVISSLIWGFSHSGYPVFPMWFRGVEVTCLGLFLSFIYLRFGIIPVIVGHYLFDVFWNCSEFLFGTSRPFYSLSSLATLLLPLAIALVAFVVNKKEEVRPMRWRLNKHQLYNLEILKSFLNGRPEILGRKSPDEIKEEIAGHGWDVAVVEAALEDLGVLSPTE